MGDSLIQQKTFEFALAIVRLYRKLQARQEFVLSPQLLRSGTSIGVKVEQASTEREHRSFLDKLIAASSDARETRYWLRLLKESRLTDIDLTPELNQIDEIIQLLADMTDTGWDK
jgi:four helix bundle protein